MRRTYFLLLSEKLLEENGVIVVGLGDVSLWVNLIDVSTSKFHYMFADV